MLCEEMEDILFSGEPVSPQMREEMQAHATQCASCHALLQHAQILRDARTLDEDISLPDSFREGWRAAVRKDAQRRPAGRQLPSLHGLLGRRTLLRTAAYACGAVILLTTGAALGRQMPITLSYEADGIPQVASTKQSGGNSVMFRSSSMDTVSGADASYDSRKIVRSAQIDLETSQFDETLETIRNKTALCGGSISYCTISGRPEDGRYASLELSIPENMLDAFLADAGALGSVTRESSHSVDMTDQYQDNASRLESAMAQKRRLDELYQQAQNMEDIVTLTNALFDIQQQIDSLTGANQSIDQRAANAQVSLSLTETLQAPALPFGDRLAEQASLGLKAFARTLGDGVLFLTWALPWLGIAALLALLVFLHNFLRHKKRANKQQAD